MSHVATKHTNQPCGTIGVVVSERKSHFCVHKNRRKSTLLLDVTHCTMLCVCAVLYHLSHAYRLLDCQGRWGDGLRRDGGNVRVPVEHDDCTVGLLDRTSSDVEMSHGLFNVIVYKVRVNGRGRYPGVS